MGGGDSDTERVAKPEFYQWMYRGESAGPSADVGWFSDLI